MSGSDFLYPFIEADERDQAGLLGDLAASAGAKMDQSAALRDETLARLAGEIATLAGEMTARFATGGRLFTFGNGGSATDAALSASLFALAPGGTPLPARSLAEDTAVLTALGNDVGFELVFSRQLIAHATASDMAMGFSTSGNSDNVVRAMAEAHRRGLLTIGLAGYDGGGMAASPDIAHCMVVRSESVHRIQETQSALVHAVWSAVQDRMGTGVPS
ncbi:MAG TPA: SIS domain-containing protein [Acidimicrobiales bacterium]|nr:SIS domain-containing protein [Acidimicrobiales bacterium]